MTAQPTPKGAWKITFLLFLFMLVNFADKIVVGLAGVPIMTELKLDAGAVRPARLLVLPAVLDLGHHRRLHRQQRRDPLGAAGDGGDLVAGAVSDGRHRQLHHALDLPHHPRRRRGAGVLGGGARDLQMVSRREAHAADRDPVAGLGLRRDPRGAGAELDHRQSQLALCVRRARRRRPDVGGGVAGDGQGRPAGADGGDGGGRSPRAVFPAVDLAHLHRLLCGDLRRLLGAVARADLVHAVHRAGARLLAKGRRVDFGAALGVRRRGGADGRLGLAGDADARLYHPRRARRARFGAAGRRRPDPRHAALFRARRPDDRACWWSAPDCAARSMWSARRCSASSRRCRSAAP